MDQHVVDWLQLSLTKGLTARQRWQYFTQYGNAKQVINNLKHNERCQFDKVTPTRLKEHLKWAQKPNNHILSIECTSYPKLLQEIPDPPTILFLKGQAQLLHNPQIAIIGSRKASFNGKETAARFAAQLSTTGLTITSGLAMGIDAAAHQGALATNGPTIAILGSGLDIQHPERNKQLYEKIEENGLLVSEFTLQTPPLPHHFPQRNRIISGLSLGVLVIEAAQKSGTLITCRFALEQNREVFALPGNINQPQAAGCHHLIQQGAKLITKYQDVIEELTPLYPPPQNALTAKSITNTLDKEHQHLLECVDFSATGVAMIQARCKFSANALLPMLSFLELHGYLKQIPNQGYARIKL